MTDFRTVPDPLSVRQRWAVAAAAVVVLVSRIQGLSRSPWDWDEILFALGMRDYNVALHHPHPPGFPLFIGAARVLRFAGLDDFHALQALNIVAAAVLVPAMFVFCRELRFRFSTSLSAALLFAFFPNVWFFGETAFSDVPAVVLVVLACALLLRGCRSGGAFLIGALLLGISAGFRPQNLLIGFLPFAIAAWCHRGRAIVAAMIVALIVVASYGAAAAATGGWGTYRQALRDHQEYITRVDSFRSAIRPPLSRVSDDFFVRPYRAPLINYAICFLALVSLVGAVAGLRWPVLIALGCFAPFAIGAWLILDFLSASRFSIGYAPMMAVLAADGIATLARRAAMESALAGALILTMVVWTAPAVAVAHQQLSPPVQAITWIRASVDPHSVLYVHRRLRPYAEYFLPGHRLEWASEPRLTAPHTSSSYYLKEGGSTIPGTRTFAWPAGNLWNVARRRYFEVSVVPLAGIRFGQGWYAEEKEDGQSWRWMARRGVVDLPAASDSARVHFRLFVPARATLRIHFNGRLLDTIAADNQSVEREYALSPRGDAGNELVLETDGVVNPRANRLGSDGRDLGLRLDQLEWILVDAP